MTLHFLRQGLRFPFLMSALLGGAMVLAGIRTIAASRQVQQPVEMTCAAYAARPVSEVADTEWVRLSDCETHPEEALTSELKVSGVLREARGLRDDQHDWKDGSFVVPVRPSGSAAPASLVVSLSRAADVRAFALAVGLTTGRAVEPSEAVVTVLNRNPQVLQGLAFFRNDDVSRVRGILAPGVRQLSLGLEPSPPSAVVGLVMVALGLGALALFFPRWRRSKDD